MWPFIPWSEIDWSPTIAGFSALIAAAVLFWTIRWSYEQKRREALTRIANARYEWMNRFSDLVAEFIAATMIAHRKYLFEPEDKLYDQEFSRSAIKIYHSILLLLRPGEYHFDRFREQLYELHEKLEKATDGIPSELFVDLEFKARAVLDVETVRAEKNLMGRTA